MVNVHCIWSSMHLTACFLLLCAPLSVPLGQWWVYNDFDQSLSSEFLWIGEVNMFSLRVSSFSLLSLSLFLSLWRPLPPSVRLLSIHSVFKRGRLLRASGDEVSPRLRQPALGLQLLPHVGHRHFHLAPSVCPTGQAGEDERLVSCTQQSLRVDPGERNLKVSLMVKKNRSVAEDNCFCLCCLSRSIWRRQSAWRASSLRGPKTSGWCSLCRCSKSPTVTMESRGVWWRRRAPAMIRSDICDYLTQYPACSSEWISPISTGENNLFFRHLPVWDFGYTAPITCLLSD